MSKHVSVATGISIGDAINLHSSIEMCAEVIVSSQKFNFNLGSAKLLYTIFGKKWVAIFLLIRALEYLSMIFSKPSGRRIAISYFSMVSILSFVKIGYPRSFEGLFEDTGISKTRIFSYIEEVLNNNFGGGANFASLLVWIAISFLFASTIVDLCSKLNFVRRYIFLNEIFERCCAIVRNRDNSSHISSGHHL